MRLSTEKTTRLAPVLFVISVVCACLSVSVRADDKKELTDRAYKAYMSGDFKQALELYRQAGSELPEAAGLEYNKGDAHYQLGDFEQALKTFEKAALTENDELAAGAHYNSGNTYFQKQDFQHAVEQYKSALQRNPGDVEARRNLEIALRNLKEQQQQQKEDKDKQENQDNQEDQQQDKQQNKEEKQDEKKDDNKERQNQEQQPKPDSSQSKPQQEPQKSNPYQMSKEDAERLLNALKDEERKHQKNKRMVSAKMYNGKDW